jgi:zinc protease
VQAVTPAQIQDYARAHLDAGGMHVVVAGDAAQFADALRAQRADAQVLQADTLDFDSATLQAPTPAK